MSGSTIRRSRVLGLAAAAALALSMVPIGGGAQAAATCAIKGFTPNKVAVGASKVQTKAFEVQTTGCGTDPDFSIDVHNGVVLHKGEALILDPAFLENTFAGVGQTFTITVGTTSKDLPFKFLRRSAISSFNATPEPVKKGKKITLKATLKRVSWTGKANPPYVGFASQPVKVQFKATGAKTYTTIKTVKSGKGGKFSTTVKASKTGTWRLNFAGLSTTGASTSPGDTVKVK